MIVTEAVYREMPDIEDTNSFAFWLAVVVTIICMTYTISNWWKR